MRKFGEIIAGFFLLVAGLVLSIPGVPGPGFVVIILGLVVLARHYHWARRALDWAHRKFDAIKQKVKK